MNGPKTARICRMCRTVSAPRPRMAVSGTRIPPLGEPACAVAGDELERVGVDDGIPVGAAVDARRQDQHAPLACLLDRGAQAVVGGAAVVQDLGEEGGRGRGIELAAGLMKDVLGERQRVAVRVQIAGVLLEQGQDAVDLLVGPATQLGSLLELALHGVAFGPAPGGQRAAVASCPGVRKAEEPDNLRDLVGIQQFTEGRSEDGRQARMQQGRRLRTEARRQIGLFALLAVGARPPQRQQLGEVLEGR